MTVATQHQYQPKSNISLVEAHTSLKKHTIYVIIWHDLHTDTTVHPFTDLKAAIAEARKTAKKMAHEPNDYIEQNYPDSIFLAEYSCEGDNVQVIEAEINKPLEVYYGTPTNRALRTRKQDDA